MDPAVAWLIVPIAFVAVAVAMRVVARRRGPLAASTATGGDAGLPGACDGHATASSTSAWSGDGGQCGGGGASGGWGSGPGGGSDGGSDGGGGGGD